MQYKTITAAFALFASGSLAMPAADPANAADVEARGLLDGILGGGGGGGGGIGGIVSGLGLFNDIIGWEPYTNDDGVYCEPYTPQYDYSYAVQYNFCYTASSGCDGCHLGGQKYPKCKKWLPYPKDGQDCQPYTVEYDYAYAYSIQCYESY